MTALMDSWPQLETKLVEYAKVEASTRQVIAKCLKALEEGDEDEIAFHMSVSYTILKPEQKLTAIIAGTSR